MKEQESSNAGKLEKRAIRYAEEVTDGSDWFNSLPAPPSLMSKTLDAIEGLSLPEIDTLRAQTERLRNQVDEKHDELLRQCSTVEEAGNDKRLAALRFLKYVYDWRTRTLRLAQDKGVDTLQNVPIRATFKKGEATSRPVQADHYAEEVGPFIDKATNLTHAYALALSVRSDGALDREAVEEHRKKKHKDERDRIRGAWRKWGYLDKGPFTSQKLPNLKRRVRAYHRDGTYPELSENPEEGERG